MSVALKQNPLIINPNKVEFYPQLDTRPSRSEMDINKYAGFEENPSLLKEWFTDVTRLSLKTLFAVELGWALSILRHQEAMKQVCSNLVVSDWSALKQMIFTNTSFNPSIKNVQALIAQGRDDEAIDDLNKLMRQLEKLDETDLRSRLAFMKAGLHHKRGKFLEAAIYYMESASIASSHRIIETLGEKGNYLKINKSGKLYHLSLLCLSSHIKIHGTETCSSLLKDLALRAEDLFEREAKKTGSILNFKKKGTVSLGVVLLPYGFFGKDEASSSLNKQLALEVKRLEFINSKRTIIRDLPNYLKAEQYKREDADILLEVLEFVEKDVNSSFADKMKFYDHMIMNLTQFRSTLEILKITAQVTHKSASVNELLKIFKHLDHVKDDEDAFINLIYLADRVSTLCSEKDRKEYLTLVLEKDYPFIPTRVKEVYSRIIETQVHSHDPSLSAFYPVTFEEFKSSLDKIEVSNHNVYYEGSILTISHEEYCDILIQKAQLRFIDQSFISFQHRKIKPLSPERVFIKSELVHELELQLNSILRDLPLESNLSYLKERLNNRFSRIGVFGLTKVGKSTFLNALLEKELLRSDRGVATNVLTLIKKSDSNKGLVHFKDKKSESIEVSEVAKYTSEQGNPSNHLNVLNVEVLLNCAIPPELILMDVPGLGADNGCFGLHEKVIEGALDLVDAAFLITTPNDGLKSFELEFIKKVTLEKKLPFILIANKMDGIEISDRDDLIQGLKERLSSFNIPVEDFDIITASGQLGLSYIEGLNEDKLMGFTVEEAKEESNIHAVKTSLATIESKVLISKNKSIKDKIIHELIFFKEQQELHLRDLTQSQNGSKVEMIKELDFLKSEAAELSSCLETIKESMEVELERLKAINPQKLAPMAAMRFAPDSSRNMKADMQGLFDKSLEVFHEQAQNTTKAIVDTLQDINSSVEKSLKRLTPHIGKMAVNSSLVVSRAKFENEFDHFSELLHRMKKIFTSIEVFEDSCANMIQHIQEEEVRQRAGQVSHLTRQMENVLNLIEERIRKKDETLNYKDKEFKEKLAVARDFIKLCEEYQEKVKSC